MKVIYPGSFDPITNGHLDIIKRSSAIFEEVIVAILINHEKKYMFSLEERIAMLESNLADCPNVKVTSASGLLVDFAKKEKVHVVVRGLRANSDYEREAQMALANKVLYPDLETLFVGSNDGYSYLSSTLVKEIAGYGGDISAFVPDNVVHRLKKKLKGD